MSAAFHHRSGDHSGPTSVLVSRETATVAVADYTTSTVRQTAIHTSPSFAVTTSCMAVTRGSAKRSSCCPSSGTTGSGDLANASGSSAPSQPPGATASEDVGNSVHQRGGGQRQSKRPALVDRTNNGSSSAASAQAVPSHFGICPGDSNASAPMNEATVPASGPLPPVLPTPEVDVTDGRRFQSASSGSAPTNLALLPISGAAASHHPSFHGSAGSLGRTAPGSNSTRTSSKRSMGARGRNRGRGSSSSGSATCAGRRRRSDGGQVPSAKQGSVQLDGSSHDGSHGTLPSLVAGMDCDSHMKDSDMENEDAQRLLLSDETLNSSSDGIGLDGMGLCGSGSESQSTLRNEKHHRAEGRSATVLGINDDSEGSRDGKTERRINAASSEAVTQLSCCRSHGTNTAVSLGGGSIQLLAVQEDLGSFSQSMPVVGCPVPSGTLISGGPSEKMSLATCNNASQLLGQSWGATTDGKVPSAEDLSTGQLQQHQWAGGLGAGCLVAPATDGTYSSQETVSAQDRLPGSIVQDPESAMASLQRRTERSLQISSIRQNRVAGSSAEEWVASSGDQGCCSQPLRGSEGNSGLPAPTLVGQSAHLASQPFLSGNQVSTHGHHLLGHHGVPQSGSVPLPSSCHNAVPLQQSHQQTQMQPHCQPAQHYHPHQHMQLQQQHRPHLQGAVVLPMQHNDFHGFPPQSQQVHQLPAQTHLLHCQPVGASEQATVAGHSAQSEAAAPNPPVVEHMADNEPGEAGPLGCFSQFMDIDSNHSDPQLCASYAAEIFQHLRASEMRRRPRQGYMETVQTDINEQMRGILIDWLVEVAEEYKLVADTLYLTCSFIDRFLSTRTVTRGRLQLLGVSCMLIASKYEEIYAPQVDEFCYITDNTYRREEVIEMERTVLKELHFELSYPTIKSFLRRFVRAAQADLPRPSIELELLGNYFAELTLVDYNSLRFLPSIIAASAVFLAKRTLWPEANPWTTTLQHYSNLTPSQLEECARNLHDLHCNRRGCTLPAIREKYRQAKFQHVASIPPCPELPASIFSDALS